MKKRTLALLMAVVMLFGVTVGGTIAWLTAEATEVVNTFTVGDIKIKLVESEVDANGDKKSPVVEVQENSYKILPGSTYDKDPKVTVLAKSENCYVYVKVTEINNDNDIILWEINTSNWLAVDGADNVYVYSANGKSATIVNYSEQAQELPSIILYEEGSTKHMDTIKINDTVTQAMVQALDGIVNVEDYDSVDAANAAKNAEIAARPKLNFDAYAVQAANMTDAVAAWNETFGK